jgi:hypothetical protein
MELELTRTQGLKDLLGPSTVVKVACLVLTRFISSAILNRKKPTYQSSREGLGAPIFFQEFRRNSGINKPVVCNVTPELPPLIIIARYTGL